MAMDSSTVFVGSKAVSACIGLSLSTISLDIGRVLSVTWYGNSV